MKNYYKILNVDPLASSGEIKKAYREQVKKYHPDVSIVEDSEEKIREINEAYATLSDEELRHQYDIDFKYTLTHSSGQSEDHKHQSYYSKRKRTKNKVRMDPEAEKTLSYTIIAFLIVMLVGIATLLGQTLYLDYIIDNNFTLEPGMSIDSIIDHYGEPDYISENEIRYDTAIISINNGKVINWYDAYGVFDLDNSDIENLSDIKIGESIEGIFSDYGYPDTYAQTFFIFGDVVVYFDANGKVVSVEKI